MKLIRYFRMFFDRPFQLIERFDKYTTKKSWKQKWRGHHPSIDQNGVAIIYEEAANQGSACALPYSGIR